MSDKCDQCDAEAIVKINGENLCVDCVKNAGAWDAVQQVKKLHAELLSNDL